MISEPTVVSEMKCGITEKDRKTRMFLDWIRLQIVSEFECNSWEQSSVGMDALGRAERVNLAILFLK